MTEFSPERTLAQADCLCNAETVSVAITKMASNITHDLAHEQPIALTVMHGGMMLSAHLLMQCAFPLQCTYVHASRYGHAASGGEVTWRVHADISLQNRTVLIIDDIFDEGHTLKEIVAYCQQQGAKTVKLAVLVNKLHDRKVQGLNIDYIGMNLPDRFLFGFGMDYQGYWRNLPAIYAM